MTDKKKFSADELAEMEAARQAMIDLAYKIKPALADGEYSKLLSILCGAGGRICRLMAEDAGIMPRTYSLETLCLGITDENRHEEVDFGCPVGREVW